jgi:cytochrome c biogenesis protein CcmG/thiol:disulfide interchange protein DsbE
MKFEKLKAAAPFIIFGFLVLVLGTGLHRAPLSLSGKTVLQIGDHVPATDWPALDGDARFTSASWRGRPYIVSFFSSWSGDSRAGHEELMTLSAAHIPLIGIIFEDSADKAAAYLARAGNPFVLAVRDDAGRISGAWGVRNAPETFVIDDQGIVRWHYAGTLTGSLVTNELMPAWEAVSYDVRER